MPVINQGWYDANGSIAYPIDDGATALADDGSRLPPNIVVDLNLRWPDELGRYAFVSGVSVTKTAVTVVLLAADAPTSASAFLPLAVVTIPQPVDEDRVYPLVAQTDGVAGWIVFGEGVRQPYTGRFSSPEQSRLAPRASRSYPAWPVQSLQVAGTALAMTGIVTLKVQPPLSAEVETREIEGVERACIVISLTADSQAQGITAAPPPTPDDNIFRQFAGPCGGRPESHTCNDPQPIEFINSVGPDCNGTITLDFSGCATVGQILGRCGATLECDLGLSGACLPPRLPGADGALPSDVPAETVTPPEPEPAPPGPTSVSESFSDLGGLPYTDCFTDQVAHDFAILLGRWEFIADNSPDPMCDDERAGVSASVSASTFVSLSSSIVPASYASATAGSRNISLWNSFDTHPTFRRWSTDLKMLPGPSGTKHNGGFLLNYRNHRTNSGLREYFIAEIDYDTQAIRFLHFDGTTYQTVATAPMLGVSLSQWYRLTVTAVPGDPGQTIISINAVSLTVATVQASLTLTTSGYVPSTGLVGLHANRAITYFSYFKVESYEG